MHGLEKARCLAEEKAGGVIHCVFVAGFLIPKDKSLKDVLGGKMPSWSLDDVSNISKVTERQRYLPI